MQALERDIKTRYEHVFVDDVTRDVDSFTFRYLPADSIAVDLLIKDLQEALPNIKTSLGLMDIEHITVLVYPSLKDFHSILPMENIPDWVVGRAWGASQLHLVTPLNPGPAHTQESILTVAIHELAHCATANISEITMDYPAWLSEGVAMYLAGQFQNPLDFKYLREGNFPGLELLADQVNGIERVYEVGYLIIEYVIDKWGSERLHGLIKSRGNIEGTLGISTDVFEREWREYVERKYLNER